MFNASGLGESARLCHDALKQTNLPVYGIDLTEWLMQQGIDSISLNPDTVVSTWKQLAMAPSRLQDFIRNVRDVFERAAMAGETAVLLTGPQIRPYVRSIIERFRGQTVVMSQNEVHPRARLKTVGQV